MNQLLLLEKMIKWMVMMMATMKVKKDLMPIFFTKETKLHIKNNTIEFLFFVCLFEKLFFPIFRIFRLYKTLIGTVQQIYPLASSFSSLEISCQSVRLFVSLEMTLILISLFFYICMFLFPHRLSFLVILLQ